MTEKFKKGQMIPKRLGMVYVDKKARQKIVFGVDVEVEGKTIRPLAVADQAVIVMPCVLIRKRNNKTLQKVSASFIGMTIDCSGIYQRAGISITNKIGTITFTQHKGNYYDLNA